MTKSQRQVWAFERFLENEKKYLMYTHFYYFMDTLTLFICQGGRNDKPTVRPKGEGGVVSAFLDRRQKGGHINVHGDGQQTRDFIYVKDIVAANIAALELGDQETIQVSTSQKTSINDILSLLTEIHGISIQREFTAPREGDIKHSCLCNEKGRNLLNWNP